MSPLQTISDYNITNDLFVNFEYSTDCRVVCLIVLVAGITLQSRKRALWLQHKKSKVCEVPANADGGGGKAKGLVTFTMIILFCKTVEKKNMIWSEGGNM